MIAAWAALLLFVIVIRCFSVPWTPLDSLVAMLVVGIVVFNASPVGYWRPPGARGAPPA